MAELGYLGLTIAYASAIALLVRARPQSRLRVLGYVGRIALTCYLLQTLTGLWLFYGFTPGLRWMGRVGPALLVPIWASGYALQLWFASAWLRRFRFGPAEWIWRSLTYDKSSLFAGWPWKIGWYDRGMFRL